MKRFNGFNSASNAAFCTHFCELLPQFESFEVKGAETTENNKNIFCCYVLELNFSSIKR
jgi:hypothetical protein